MTKSTGVKGKGIPVEALSAIIERELPKYQASHIPDDEIKRDDKFRRMHTAIGNMAYHIARTTSRSPESVFGRLHKIRKHTYKTITISTADYILTGLDLHLDTELGEYLE